MSNSQQSLDSRRIEAAKELLRRRKARASLHDFIRYINPDYIVSQFSLTVCAELDEFLEAMQRGERPVLIFGAPPQHGKSDIVSRYLPSYAFGRFPDLRIGGLSYAKDLASDMNRDVQRIMLTEEYKRLFPDSALQHSGDAKRNGDAFDIPNHKGSYVGQGVGGPLTGKKLDLGIIDDPIKNSKEALSATVKEAVWKWYGSTFLTRLSKNSGQIIMATRWAVDDLSGKVLEANKRAKSLVFKAIDDEGNALVPELHPKEKLLETKAIIGEYFWTAMYQQSPVALGGNMFKSEWWQYYDVMPEFKYRAIFADTAQKTAEQNDYTVFQCWGFLDGRAYLIDQLRGKWEAPDLLTRARAFWNKHKAVTGLGTLRSFSIEDKSSGTGLIQTLKKGGNGQPAIPVRPIQRDKDKITRAMDALPSVEAGLIYLPREAPFLSDFLEEVSAFPTGAHDDQVDPLMDAVTEVSKPKFNFFA